MKSRILLLGMDHVAAVAVHAALGASDWAEPVRFPRPPESVTADDLRGVQGVFNGTMGRPAAILAAARALFGAAGRTGGDIRVVHLSSMTVYGSFEGDAREETESRSDLGAYGAAQIEAEALAGAYPRCVILRPGCEYGPACAQWSERIARLLVARRLGDLGAAGDGVCNLLFIDDLVGAVLAALRTPGIDGQRLNLAMRGPPTWNEYFVQFGRALGAVPIARIGARRLRMEAKLLAPPLKIMELLGQRLRGRPLVAAPAITASLLNLCAQTLTMNVDKAEQALDLRWTPLQAGLRRAAESFRTSSG